jgi:peptidoglycan/LPS O-acetylase OafA/YrhL
MQKLKSLEAVRGLAALSVVVYHLIFEFYPAMVNGDHGVSHMPYSIELFFAKSPLYILYSGNFAVCIFFVLSGFVLSYKYFKTENTQIVIATAFKRYFRLVIPVCFSVLVVYLCTLLQPNSPYGVQNPSFLGALYEGFYGSFFRHTAEYNPQLWTMSYEFFGSFLVFGFCLIFGNRKNRLFGYILAVIILWNDYYLGFVLGILICDLYCHKDEILKNKAVKWLLLALGIYLGAYPDINPLNITLYGALYHLGITCIVYHTVGAAIVILVVIHSIKITKILSKKLFQFFGKISFSMYLAHVAVLYYVAHPVFSHLTDHIHLSYKYSFVITALIYLGLTFSFSYLMYRYIDQNGIRLSNYIYNRLFHTESDQKKYGLVYLKKQ